MNSRCGRDSSIIQVIAEVLNSSSGANAVQIHLEQGSEYRCQDCRERCAVFILARDSELRLCESCFEKLRDLLSQPGAANTPAPTVTEMDLRVKSYLSRNRTAKLRLTSRGS